MTCGVGIEQLALPLARRSDPETSHAAAARVAEFSAGHHAAILAALRGMPCGGTVYEIASAVEIPAHAIGKRMIELQRDGKVRDTGLTSPSPSNRPCRVWKVTR